VYRRKWHEWVAAVSRGTGNLIISLEKIVRLDDQAGLRSLINTFRPCIRK
jgi:hypothetical protein